MLRSKLERAFRGFLRQDMRLTTQDGHPNINDLWAVTKDLEALKLNVKAFGYELARDLEARLTASPVYTAEHVGLACKPATQADIESRWYRYWTGQLKRQPVAHRKLWEFAYILQAFYEHGFLEAGRRVVGFGVGFEPLPSYFAAQGLEVLATDLPNAEMAAAGWRESPADSHRMRELHHPELVDFGEFSSRVAHRHADMKALPADLREFDACWSACALEHLGSIQAGMDFIKASLETLRPGGLAVHTTEFNFLNDAETLDNWVTVLPQRKHFLSLADELRAQGHRVAPLDFDVGTGLIDRYIDIPPFEVEGTESFHAMWREGWQRSHLKLAIDGFASTSFGIVIRKAG